VRGHVQALRDRFGLTRYQCNTVSGFLRRLEFGTFGRFPYIMLKIRHTGGAHPSDPLKCRYLVKQKTPDTAAHAADTDRPGDAGYAIFPTAWSGQVRKDTETGAGE
jgi:hypothetical protein